MSAPDTRTVVLALSPSAADELVGYIERGGDRRTGRRPDGEGRQGRGGRMSEKRYYAIGLVVVVEAESAEEAFENVNPPRDGANLSEDGKAYVGVVFSGEACPITPAMAAGPDWAIQLYYSASEMEIATGVVLPLMEGDE
jgi:hypothetical protein